MKELEWRDIKVDGLSKYEICPTGVRTKKTKRMHKLVLRGRDDNNMYYAVKLSDDNNNRRYYQFHVLLAKTFIPNPNNLPCVNHIDENKLNNELSNLEWVTYSENSRHGTCRERILSTRIDRNSSNAEIAVLCLKDGIPIQTYKSISEASRILHLKFSNIAACVRGERKTCGGYSWEAISA